VDTDWDASTYDRVSDPQLRWGVGVLERLELKGDETVLDAGCGTGRVTERLLARLPRGRVIALDASSAMIEEARTNLASAGGRVEFMVADLADALPVASPVDAVFSTATFHWVLDHDRLISNLAAIMRPGAQLVAQCGGVGNIASIREAVRALGQAVDDTYFATPEETVRRLRAAGFYDVVVWLNEEPTAFETEEQVAEFLEAVVLRRQLAAVAEDERARFVREVIVRLPGLEIDYVRLNICAMKDHSAGPAAEDWDCRW
jgi:trans-aconitate 2-methyltransferase